ncbi:hypothetical protein H8S11_07060 [Flintibacter sp. NSJ-23]|uniref:Uncharacterized protein n=1 Tax=Flintibacter hominis TaxID=2763048 RepID=A0A8J6J9T7_9FIRM|nr:hypothetical protein [Flintibacter hominis]MBC5722567.1 hypothetical protein [Flintibacter hominis]
MNNQRIRKLDLADLGRRCRPYTGPEAMKKVRDAITGGGCAYFGVVKEQGKLRLISAEVSQEADLLHLLDRMELFRVYAEGGLSPRETGLTASQVMDLVCYGYGFAVLLDMEDRMVYTYYLPKESDSPVRCVKKLPMGAAPLGCA